MNSSFNLDDEKYQNEDFLPRNASDPEQVNPVNEFLNEHNLCSLSSFLFLFFFCFLLTISLIFFLYSSLQDCTCHL